MLARCRKLHVLQLQQCVGPLAVPDMLPAPPAAQQQHRWQLSMLQLQQAGAAAPTADAQLVQLLGLPCMAARSACWPALTSLCLVRVCGLSDRLLVRLADAGCRLLHLRLEDCWQPASPAAPVFSEPALLQLLARSCASSLHSLQLRHAVGPLSADAVALLLAAAPLLQQLVLDACDLPGGAFAFEPWPHAALQAVHVSMRACVRCVSRCAQPAAAGRHTGLFVLRAADIVCHRRCLQVMRCNLLPSVPALHDCTHGSAMASDQQRPRRCDKQLVVHLLQVGRSLHLPAG